MPGARRRRSMISVPFHDKIIACNDVIQPYKKKQKTAAAVAVATNELATSSGTKFSATTSPSPSKLRIKIHSPFKASKLQAQKQHQKQQQQQQQQQQDNATRKVTAKQLDFMDASLMLEPTPIEKMWRLEDHYQLQQLLGEGAYGKVYEAIRISDGQHLALKVIPKYTSTDQALEREIQSLSSLSTPGHEHVCQLYDHHRDEHNVYLAMEYIVGGGELFEHLVRAGPFSEQDAANFLQEFAQGLAYIHSKGYTHGDLKPENLLMSNDAQRPCVKIVDFGFCVPNTKRPPTKLIFGTVAYLAPEILKNLGVPQQPTPPVDMYAVGVIMYTLLTGTHPFDRTNSASDESIKSAMINSLYHANSNQNHHHAPDYLSQHVFDDRVSKLSQSAIDLMRNLLQPCPEKRMTSQQLQQHPWIKGQTATRVLLHSDTKLRRFWQRRFRAAIMKKFHVGILSTDENLKAIYYDSMDITGDGKVDFEEFQVAMKDIFGIHQMKDLFNSVDIQDNGYLEYEEFEAIMKTQFDNVNTSHLISRADTLGVMANTVAENGGMMPPKEPKVSQSSVATTATASTMASRRSTIGVRAEILRQFGRRTSTTSRHDLELIFMHLDQNQDGTVDISELMDFLQDQHNVDSEAISAWADEVDRDMDGTISFEEFYTAMTTSR
ncbi:unnamed protein product [Cylindrotheca closterium]|uniref:Calmodulin n=1 Tax=Cylindrotheca closterium TaxID=2856 RepID=A0AAD2CNA6_9STRA|nr:unnamed protein product [Cylindrotheca closterium]